MLTKSMIAIVLAGALWVAGDAAYKQIGCCNHRSGCNAPPPCCTLPQSTGTGDCCQPQSECCNPDHQCCPE